MATSIPTKPGSSNTTPAPVSIVAPSDPDPTLAYEIEHAGAKLLSAAYEATLTNNPSEGVQDELDAEKAAMLTLLGGTVVPSTSAIVASGSSVTIGSDTYTFTVVDGAITAIAVTSTT